MPSKSCGSTTPWITANIICCSREKYVLQRLFLALCCDFEEKQSVLWNELLFSHNIIMCVNYICATFSIMFILCLNMNKNFHSYYFALIPIRCLFKIATYLWDNFKEYSSWKQLCLHLQIQKKSIICTAYIYNSILRSLRISSFPS